MGLSGGGGYKNEYGQVSCDGFCPDKAESMKDSMEKIYPDSLASFYRLIDTTHQYHSAWCKSDCFEFGDANYIEVQKKSKDTVVCYTMCNASTHCSLRMVIVKDYCFAKVQLRSVSDGRNYQTPKAFSATVGIMVIDKTLWEKGILKASFNFYLTSQSHIRKINWQGKAYKKIEAP